MVNLNSTTRITLFISTETPPPPAAAPPNPNPPILSLLHLQVINPHANCISRFASLSSFGAISGKVSFITLQFPLIGGTGVGPEELRRAAISKWRVGGGGSGMGRDGEGDGEGGGVVGSRLRRAVIFFFFSFFCGHPLFCGEVSRQRSHNGPDRIECFLWGALTTSTGLVALGMRLRRPRGRPVNLQKPDSEA